MRVWPFGFAISLLTFLPFFIPADANWSSTTCPAVSVKDSFLGLGDLCFGYGNGSDIVPVSIVEGVFSAGYLLDLTGIRFFVFYLPLAQSLKVGISQGLSQASLESGFSSATTSLSLGTRVWFVAIQPSSDPAISGMYRGGEVSLQKALHMVYSDSNEYVAVLFYASWCPFSRAFRPTFSILASLYPSISHLAIEESAVRPSILSKYGVHGFPALFILNSTMRAQYRGLRSLSPVAAFYSDITRIQSAPQHKSAMGKVGRLSNYEKTDEEENCPFSWARSPENLFRHETYLALATAFVLLRLACVISPFLLEFTRFVWTRHMDFVRLNRLTSVSNSSGEPQRRSNLQERAKAAGTWASKSLASAVPIGDASTSRRAGLVEGQGSGN